MYVQASSRRTNQGSGWSRQTDGAGIFVLHYGFDQASGTPIRFEVWLNASFEHPKPGPADCSFTVQVA